MCATSVSPTETGLDLTCGINQCTCVSWYQLVHSTHSEEYYCKSAEVSSPIMETLPEPPSNPIQTVILRKLAHMRTHE